MTEMAGIIVALIFVVFAVALLFRDQIAALVVVRELRKQAAMLPEERREAYLREGLAHLDNAISEKQAPRDPR